MTDSSSFLSFLRLMLNNGIALSDRGWNAKWPGGSRAFLRSSPVRNYRNFLNASYFREDRSKSFRIQPTDL